jgi:hypothetical protein
VLLLPPPPLPPPTLLPLLTCLEVRDKPNFRSLYRKITTNI